MDWLMETEVLMGGGIEKCTGPSGEEGQYRKLIANSGAWQIILPYGA
jgi:hypothetical protein